MATRAGVGRLVLTHIAPYLDPEKSLMDAESVFEGEVSLAVPGARIRI
jgi:ribonuclease BN (tRNA processing enzyme)